MEQTEQAEQFQPSQARLGNQGQLIHDNFDARKLIEKFKSIRDFADRRLCEELAELFLTPKAETGDLAEDYWIQLPTAWVGMPRSPRRTLYFPKPTPWSNLGRSGCRVC